MTDLISHPFLMYLPAFPCDDIVNPLPSSYLSPTYPSFRIERRWLISEPLSPAAICSSRTETHYLALCGRLEMELFIRQSRALSALCRLHYSLCYVWETISVSCFLRCYLLVVPLEMGLGSGDLSSSQRGSLIKEPNIPLCASEIWLQEMRKMSENLTATICPSRRHPWARYTV